MKSDSDAAPNVQGLIAKAISADNQEQVKEKDERPKDIEEDEDFFSKMKQQAPRYFLQDFHNPTVKCRNCKEFGHLARECPNDFKSARLNCILCGKDGHDSFECNEKLCFKCNAVGHKASECRAEGVLQCSKCHNVGHREGRCLKVWSSTNSAMRRCMECGKNGHFKCMSERKSAKIKLKFKVRDNLDEFFVTSKDSDIK